MQGEFPLLGLARLKEPRARQRSISLPEAVTEA
jgi:hypothetical protein